MLTEKTQEYFKEFQKEVRKVYALAEEAKKTGLDPDEKVEIPLAMSMAEKVVGVISTMYPQMLGSGIAQRILDLEEKYGKLDPTVPFTIAEEVAKQKFCQFSNLIEAMEAGIRIGFAYQTIGVVSSPLEGFTGLKVRKTRDGKDYIEASFSGPIRSAGTTAGCVAMMLIDYLRELFGYAKYDPTEEEIKRVYTELSHFHDRITNLQYMPTEEECNFLARNLPVQIAGDASEKLEVPNYKNLDRVDTDYLRSGVCLIIGEALALKLPKAFRLLNMAKKNGIKSTGFDFVEEYIELHEKALSGKAGGGEAATYMKDLVAGRPVFGHPSRSGGFRYRYGRGRVSGFSAASLHPATMAITDDFIATGTQLKIEKPTKGCVTTVCDKIDGPIVKLVNGSVKKLNNLDEARKYYPDVEEIIYLGDILFPFSDLANRNYVMIKPGYVEEWWELELREKGGEVEDIYNVSFEDALRFSEEYGIPFYPKYIFYWTEISKKEFLELLEWIKRGRYSKKIILPFSKSDQVKFKSAKRALEVLGVEHEVTIENVVIGESVSKSFLFNLGIENVDEDSSLSNFLDFSRFEDEEDVLKIINAVAKYEIKDKAGEFIGCRMGRPEKSKLRKLTGSPNGLFPVGSEGGRLRSVNEAVSVGKVNSAFPKYHCEGCNHETIYPSCEQCGSKTKKLYKCAECGKKSYFKCKEHERSFSYEIFDLDIPKYFQDALGKVGMKQNEAPVLIKGIRGTSSEGHVMEHLAKGILRAKHDLQVNKDGTIRMDATELPLVAFKPKEIEVSVEMLKKLGYCEDVYGKPLENEDQILELMPHDVLLPCPVGGTDEKADDVFMRLCNFVDEELERFYGLKPYYNVKSREDLVGQLGVCMAPHNCAGVICRFIGFSNTQGLMASPYMHAAIRRDCDGDEAAIMLLGDVLLNFSRKFLPSHRGGTQDAPLVLNAKIDAGEVDDQILDLEMVEEYPLEMYRKAEKKVHSSEVDVFIVKNALKEGKDPFVKIGFTHDTENFNEGVVCSSYKLLATMQEKVAHQMELVEKLRSVDTADTARLVIERHFIRDLRGNLRKFSMQAFRCVACNEIVRRPPLRGNCPKCGGKLIFTIHEGGIKKYLEPALELANKYNLSSYMQQNLELVKRYVDSVFGKELEKQEALGKWF